MSLGCLKHLFGLTVLMFLGQHLTAGCRGAQMLASKMTEHDNCTGPMAEWPAISFSTFYSLT